MPIASISIRRFRNLQAVELTLSPQLNLFVGDNGAGKTSLLEALFVLARGRSFRTSQLDRLIQHGADNFEVVVHAVSQDGRSVPVGLRRSRGHFECRIDGRAVKRLSELAALFPVQWLGGNLHALVEDGPAYRRQFLDWGLFHVKQDYIALSRRFCKLLKQRNAALRSGASQREVQAWHPDLGAAGDAIDRYRSEYLARFESVFQGIAGRFPALEGQMAMLYRKGWAGDVGYQDALESGLQGDIESGFTRTGPQRAELRFQVDGKAAGDCLSRGQQKTLIATLQLAQAMLLHQETGRCSLFLLDDLGAELDPDNQRRLLELLTGIRAQVFVTAIESPALPPAPSADVRKFHVKHGAVSEVV